MTPKLKKIILIVLALIVLFVIYAVFIKKAPEGDVLVKSDTATQTSTDARLLGTKISQALLRIEQIKLDKSVFTSDIYKSLRDRSVAITEEPMGRSNPFAPLGDVSVNSVTRSASSTATSTSSLRTATSTRPVTN